MLLGKNLRWRYKHGLPARSHSLHHGCDRDHGFAGSNLALQQSLHGVVARHIGGNIGNNLPLTARQSKRQ